MIAAHANKSLQPVQVAFAFTTRQELWFAVAVVLILGGTFLQWHLPRQRMSAEERMKDGKLTEAEANRKIRLNAIAAPTLTISGCVLLIAALAGYVN
jgi:hypothetical protein